MAISLPKDPSSRLQESLGLICRELDKPLWSLSDEILDEEGSIEAVLRR